MIATKKIEIRYSETDQMGIVYHAHYVVWCELGRSQFFSDMGFNMVELEHRGLLFPIRDVHLTYLKPCKYGEEVTIYTWVKEYNDIKTIYEHEIKVGDELRAKGTTTVVSVKKDGFKLVKLSKLAPEVHQRYIELMNKQ